MFSLLRRQVRPQRFFYIQSSSFKTSPITSQDHKMSKPQKPKVTRTATCNCEHVELTVSGVDRGAVLCHCDNCQRSSGSTFAHNHRFLPSELKFQKGEDLVKQFQDGRTDSGNTINRHFCSNCGSSLYLTNPDFPTLTVVHAGVLQGEKAKPITELFTINKSPWVAKVGDEKAKM